MSMKVTTQFDAKALQKQLDRIPVIVQSAALAKGIRPAAKVVQKRVKDLTPRSTRTKSKDKWSKATKAKRSGERPLHQLVKVKVLPRLSTVATALVGYEWPSGNKGHFLLPLKKSTRKLVLWGKVTGREVRKMDDWLRRAFDETKGEQASAFEQGVKREVDRRLKEIGDG